MGPLRKVSLFKLSGGGCWCLFMPHLNETAEAGEKDTQGQPLVYTRTHEYTHTCIQAEARSQVQGQRPDMESVLTKQTGKQEGSISRAFTGDQEEDGRLAVDSSQSHSCFTGQEMEEN